MANFCGTGKAPGPALADAWPRRRGARGPPKCSMPRIDSRHRGHQDIRPFLCRKKANCLCKTCMRASEVTADSAPDQLAIMGDKSRFGLNQHQYFLGGPNPAKAISAVVGQLPLDQACHQTCRFQCPAKLLVLTLLPCLRRGFLDKDTSFPGISLANHK